MRPDLSQLLVRRPAESEKLEFRPGRASVAALGRSVCGMLNQQGGWVFWGVDDGRVSGVKNATVRAQELSDFLMANIKPLPLLSVAVERHEGAEVIVVNVAPGADRPYSVQREIWVRVGSQNLRADPEQTAHLVERSAARLRRWEREPMPGFSLDDCDTDELGRAREEIAKTERFGLDVPTTDEDLLRRLYLWRSGQLTNAAVVLFAARPLEWMPNLALRLVVYGAGKGGPLSNDTFLVGPAIKVLRQTIENLQQRTGHSSEFDPLRLERQERPAYALFAFREGLVNALVHRDYTLPGGDVRIELHPDRLVISNPGRLPEGWTAESLKAEHTSNPVNHDIARVFYLRGLMEQLGMGTRKVIEACEALGAPAPTWDIEPNRIRLTLFRAPEAPREEMLPERQSRFLQDLPPEARFKAAEYARSLGLSERQARRDLAQLEERGILERLGRGPRTAYRRTSRLEG